DQPDSRELGSEGGVRLCVSFPSLGFSERSMPPCARCNFFQFRLFLRGPIEIGSSGFFPLLGPSSNRLYEISTISTKGVRADAHKAWWDVGSGCGPGRRSAPVRADIRPNHRVGYRS